LPDIDGVDVAKRLREWTEVPIIVLSARGQERDKVDALDAGADDYLTKPFGLNELTARIRVALRHFRPNEPDVVFEAYGVRIDLASHQVFRDSKEVHLTPNEFKLLAVLVRHAGKVVTHRYLLEEVWGPAFVLETHYLRVYMGQLRHKLEANPAQPKFLTNEPGVGYRLRTE
jgi:two-component system KDP operon response regulator KdpE